MTGVELLIHNFINPQHKCKLKDNSARANFELKERLTVYPRFIREHRTYLDSNLVNRISAMSRGDSLWIRHWKLQNEQF